MSGPAGVLADPTTVARIESAFARTAAAVASARARQDPTSGAGSAAWLGGFLVSSGRDGYVNRAIGAAVGRPADADDLVTAERFFADRGLPVEIEVCPATHPTLPALLAARQAHELWSRPALVRDVSPADPADAVEALEVRRVTDADVPRWQAVHRAGFEVGSDGARRSDHHTAAARAAGGRVDLLATIDGVDVGAASLEIVDGCAVFGGTATVPAYRRRGIHGELIRRRLRLAAEAGCDLAVVSASAGSASERNLRRLGFGLAYVKRGLGIPVVGP